MRRVLIALMVSVIVLMACDQALAQCSCGSNPPGPPAPRSLKPYANAPEDLRPFSKFTPPYYENYQDLIEYNGAARDIPDPDLKDLSEIRIGFVGPLYNHPEQALGKRMLNGVTLAVDEANAAGGYCGKPFKLMLHNDSAVWGAASNEIVKMVYDEKVWAMFGSISGDTTHIGLRVTLKAETPLVNSAATDPTIPETIIPWYFTDLQDDRVQGYTLARHIYTELGLKRVAILRVNDRYGRFGVLKFRDASRRLGHPVVIEQKFRPGDTDFRHQLEVIQDSRVDAVVLWTDIGPTAGILQQMRELGMKQPVFGSHRTIGDELVKLAGPAAEGFEAVYPYDPTRSDPRWLDFNSRYDARFHEKPDHFAALAYDAMQILLDAICRAGLNKGRIRDALTGVTSYKGVTGDMVFDPNCKNIAPMYLGTVHHGNIEYRRITMGKPNSAAATCVGELCPVPAGPRAIEAGQIPASTRQLVQTGQSSASAQRSISAEETMSAKRTPYARVGEDGVQYFGPPLPDQPSSEMHIGVFGPQADEIARSPEVVRELSVINASQAKISLVAIPSQLSWGKASNELVKAVYENHALALIALDRASSHLAEQIGVKAFVPVIAISSDRALTSTNIPWIFRLPEGTPFPQALRCLTAAIDQAGPNRARIRELLSSGAPIAGVRFESTGEVVK